MIHTLFWVVLAALIAGIAAGFCIGAYVGYGKGWKDSGNEIREEEP